MSSKADQAKIILQDYVISHSLLANWDRKYGLINEEVAMIINEEVAMTIFLGKAVTIKWLRQHMYSCYFNLLYHYGPKELEEFICEAIIMHKLME